MWHALELVEKAARAAKADAARQILVHTHTTAAIDGTTRVALTLSRGNAKFTGRGRGRAFGGRPPKANKLRGPLFKSVNGAAKPADAIIAEVAAASYEAEAAPAHTVEAAGTPTAEPAAEAAAAAPDEAGTAISPTIDATAARDVSGQTTCVAVLEERGEDADHEVLLAQCVMAAGSAGQAREPSNSGWRVRWVNVADIICADDEVTAEAWEPSNSGWRVCWVNVAVVILVCADDEVIAEAWEAFMRCEETAEASAARRALAAEAAEAAAEVDVRRAAAEEGLTLPLTEGTRGPYSAKKRSNFRFVSWAGVACPGKPWAVSIYDAGTRKQQSHGYYATSWEAALKVARILGPAKCRELDEQHAAQQAAKAARAAAPMVEAPWAVMAPKAQNQWKLHLAKLHPELLRLKQLAPKAPKAPLSPALLRWAKSRVQPPRADLRKWSALQGKPSSASGRCASLGRSRLLVDAVREIQRPQREREAADAEAWELAAAEGLTLRTSEKASSGFHMVSYIPPPNSSYSSRHKWYLARSKVAWCNASGRLGVFASPVQAALAVARHEAAQPGRAPDASPAGVSTIIGRSHLGVTAILDCSPRGGEVLRRRGSAAPVETELRVAFLRQRTETLLQEHDAEVLRAARREEEEKVRVDAARAESGVSSSTRRLLQQKRAEAAEKAETEAAARLAARPSLEARGVKAAAYEQALVEWRDASAQQELKQSLADEARRELQRQCHEARLHCDGEAATSRRTCGRLALSALQQAEAEGLTLQPADNAAGFKGVSFSGGSRPSKAQVWRGGKLVHLGCFATAEEAALCYARDIAANGSLSGTVASCSSDRPLRPAAPPAKRQRTDPCEVGGIATDGSNVFPAAADAVPDWATIAPDLPHAGLLHVDEQGAVYRVEALLAVRKKPKLAEHRQFLVRWAEYGAEDDSWEDEHNVLDKSLIKAYDRTAKATAKALEKSGSCVQQRPRAADRQSSSVSLAAAAIGNGGGGGEVESVDLLGCLEAGPTAAILGDTTHSPMNAWGFVAESDCGRGLFARVDLTHDQFIAEYTGPRLPGRLQKMGSYVLQIPGANDIVIDGASENSPFRCPCSPAIYANHSRAPNARLEMWPVPRPGSLELRQHMVIVATERIAAGYEIRINYEHTDGTYWKGASPAETAWRTLHVTPPPATGEQPVVNRLAELQAAAALGRATPRKPRDHVEGLPWEGEDGGDVRLRVLVPLLATKTYGFGGVLARVAYNWPMVATHLPGRSGHECRDRWLDLMRADMAGAQADSDSDDGGSECREHCVVLGCKRQLVRCHGIKEAGSTVGVAEQSHVLCVPCLERWFVSQNELRREKQLPKLVRRSCPICQTELRAVRGETAFHLGLQKIDWSWGDVM